MARNTLILLQQVSERRGLPVTATGNLSRAVVTEMRKLIEWPDYDQVAMFQFKKVINEPDFLRCAARDGDEDFLRVCGGVWQRAKLKYVSGLSGAAGRSAGRTQQSAEMSVRALRRAAFRLALHSAARRQRAVVALSHPSDRQTLGPVRESQQRPVADGALR